MEVELGVLPLGEPQATCQPAPRGSRQGPGPGRGAIRGERRRVQFADSLDLAKAAVESVAREQSAVVKLGGVRSGSVFALTLDV